ncbi:hypothetical protein PGB34_13925 [Xenophilus arseniciresistens]|uniref:Uncharacterized protein n=1 Tax=Xenophilus arseniciresistens TaxID=1283306 RepID=A0AAE3ND76_9BURK|nr:hypothetical protein [Xenophilus arseniciresistens]MDA7417464.1 hypothetical protein [Xenophilus arseniciresistens]
MIYFSDVFGVEPEVVDTYGAFNIALVNDLPLFVDPFLLFDSERPEYRELHDDIIKYLVFVRDRAQADELTEGAISQWLFFREVKQNWLGFSRQGNSGTGLGKHFAEALARNFKRVFRNFGDETLTRSSHLEKLGLLSGGVGRDHLSDFTTNLIKGYLLKYTEDFAAAHLQPGQLKRVHIERVAFNYETRRWQSGHFMLPWHAGDYVILTPCEMLTRDEAWINQGDMVSQFFQLRLSLPDEALRAQVNDHFLRQISERSTQEERKAAALRTIEQFTDLIDYYIKWKEDHAAEAHAVSTAKVQQTHAQFVENIRELVLKHLIGTEFYERGDSYEEALQRAKYLKHVIEDNDGYRVFYVDGKPVKRESDLHTMFRLTWYATAFDVNAEVNNGRGPVDYKVSKGKQNASLVEFKLASNSSLRRNLEKQVEVYAKASQTEKSIKVIMYFSDRELEKVTGILRELKLKDREDIVLIDAGRDNKPSASNA